MKQKSAKTLARPMPERWHTIIAGMVLGGMTFEAAGQQKTADGSPLYSRAYIRTDGHLIKQDPRFSKALSEKRAEVAKVIGWDKRRWDTEAASLYNDCLDNDDRTNAQGVLDKIGKRIGVYELDNSQKDQTWQAYLKWLEQGRETPTGAKQIDSEVVNDPALTSCG